MKKIPYRSMTGSINYFRLTRPDLAVASSVCSQANNDWGPNRIFYIHCVYTLGYIYIYIVLQRIYIVLHFLSHNVYRKKYYPMYIRQNALQCIYPMYIKCNTMYIPPYTLTAEPKKGYIHWVALYIHLVAFLYTPEM